MKKRCKQYLDDIDAKITGIKLTYESWLNILSDMTISANDRDQLSRGR